MFSSIAAFIFGSSTTEGTNCKTIEDCELHKSQNCYLTNDRQRKENLEEDSKNIETNGEYQQGIRNNNKRNNRQNKGKKCVPSKIKAVTIEPAPILDVVTSELSDVDFDLDDDWLLVQKDDVDIPNSFFRKSSKENLILAEHNNRTSKPISEILNITTVQQHNISNNSSQTLQNNCEKHKSDLTSGFSQSSSGPTAVQISPLSNLGYRPSKSVVTVAKKTRLLTDNNDTQLLHVANHSKDLEPNLSSVSIDSNGSGAKLFTMVDSWYMTPPPCFVSTGPIYMEMSPFENLLIEHPSMSIYHSIKSTQQTPESFAKFDLEVSESSQIQEEKENFYTQKSPEIVFAKPSAAILEQVSSK
uniref:Tumor protein p53-inducible nuclear protein 1 n=1 Tax=Bactrocera latifrons TaxID=174628 RepID=A0A0K8TZ87_BACLA